MKVNVEVTYSFKEELIGDEAGSDAFYLRMTPVVKVKPATDAKPSREDLNKIAKAVLAAIKKKGPIK